MTADDLIRQLVDPRGAEFPQRPGAVGLGYFEDLATTAADRARQLITTVGVTALIPNDRRDLVMESSRSVVASNPSDLSAHVIGHDGVDERITSTAMTIDNQLRIASEGGGLILSNVDRFVPTLADAASLAAVAWGSPARAYALLGSDPTRILDSGVSTSIVIPLSEDVIAHPTDATPIDIAMGSMSELPGWPRISATSGAFTVVVTRRRFDEGAHHAVLLTMARHHPLLRVDLPLDRSQEGEVYGSSTASSYLAMLQGEVADLRGRSGGTSEWWWTLSHPLAPLRVVGELRGRSVVGRFPGGVGILTSGTDSDALIVRAAGVTLHVPLTCIELFEALLSGEPVVCTASNELSLRHLGECGVIALCDEPG